MTDFTIISGIVFFIDIACVNVLMAIGTKHPDLPETPFFLFFMAGETRGCKMGTLQLEIRSIMLLNCK